MRAFVVNVSANIESIFLRRTSDGKLLNDVFLSGKWNIWKMFPLKCHAAAPADDDDMMMIMISDFDI